MTSLLAGIAVGVMMMVGLVVLVFLLIVAAERLIDRNEAPYLVFAGEKCRMGDAPRGLVFDGRKISHNLACSEEIGKILLEAGYCEFISEDTIVQPVRIAQRRARIPDGWMKAFRGDEGPIDEGGIHA